ncbi:hypothetical protein Tco_0523823, partial [Tanacetum coccineum]
VPQVIYDQEEACQEDEAEQAHSSLDSHEDRQHHQVQCQAQALAQNQARILRRFCSLSNSVKTWCFVCILLFSDR